VTVALAVRGGCRFVTRGRLSAPRSCRRPLRLRVGARNPRPGFGTWRLRLVAPLARGRYVVTVRATDTRGNAERSGATRTLTVR
jgi:hypothetical protein